LFLDDRPCNAVLFFVVIIVRFVEPLPHETFILDVQPPDVGLRVRNFLLQTVHPFVRTGNRLPEKLIGRAKTT
jgi:hypothetical protein